MVINRFYSIDGDTYDGGDIDLTFPITRYADAKAAYDHIKAPYKRLAIFGDERREDGNLYQVVTALETHKEV